MSLDERELVPLAKSLFSIKATDSPREIPSSAMPAPVMPPPMTARSKVSRPMRWMVAVLVSSENLALSEWDSGIVIITVRQLMTCGQKRASTDVADSADNREEEYIGDSDRCFSGSVSSA